MYVSKRRNFASPTGNSQPLIDRRRKCASICRLGHWIKGARRLMTKPIEHTSPYDLELAGYDRLMFDGELERIDRMGRSTQREAIRTRGYPKARKVGLRSAWLYSEVIAWVRAQPAGEGPATPRKALSEGVKTLRRKHAQRIAEAGDKIKIRGVGEPEAAAP